jgi:hypothetical protein
MLRPTLIAASVLAAVTLAACSSGGSGARSSSAPNATGPSTSVAGRAQATAAGTAAPGGPNKNANNNAWCREVDNDAATMLNGRPDPTAPLTAQEKQTVQRFAADAPGGIRGDVQTLVDYEFAEAAGKTSDPSAAHIFTSTTHVMQWLQTNCPSLFHKLNPGVGLSTPPASGSS